MFKSQVCTALPQTCQTKKTKSMQNRFYFSRKTKPRILRHKTLWDSYLAPELAYVGHCRRLCAPSQLIHKRRPRLQDSPGLENLQPDFVLKFQQSRLFVFKQLRLSAGSLRPSGTLDFPAPFGSPFLGFPDESRLPEFWLPEFGFFFPSPVFWFSQNT